MKAQSGAMWLIGACWLLVALGAAQAQIHVDSARIGCLDIQKDANLTAMVGSACNGQFSCSFKAPTEQEYSRAGVQARTRTFCTQGMEIVYRCGNGGTRLVSVPGDAWTHPAAELACAPVTNGGGGSGTPRVNVPSQDINVTAARIGCLDVQKTPNLTALVAGACNGKQACSYKAPTENQYRAAGVQAATRPFCTQGMEIAYQCSGSGSKFISVPGDAWDHQPAELYCEPPSSDSTGPGITVTGARIGCLDIQKQPNLTALVASACNGKASCSYKAPTESQYRAAGVEARTRPLCTQAMEIAFRCGNASSQTVMVPGDAWGHPPAELSCEARAVDPRSILGGYQVGALPPEPNPVIPPGDDVIVYVHGGPGSRLEEASDLAGPLLNAGLVRGKRYTVISLDQPSEGYSLMVHPTVIVPPHDKIGDYYPLVAFSENFLAAFINQVNAVAPIKNRKIDFIGGSMGGALALRMGHRSEPWINKIVAWNPASVWTTYTHDLLKGKVLHDGFDMAKQEESTDPGIREKYFNLAFGQPTPVTQPNPEEWYRGDRDHYSNDGTQRPFRSEWDCKWDYIAASRLEQQEVYNATYRKWHWRLGTELLVFSLFNDDWAGPANTAADHGAKPANFLSIRKPTLLAAGDDDDWNEGPALHWENRFRQTQVMATRMQNTPGYALFLPNTGHSIHNERPQFFADQIATFLSGPAPTAPLRVNAVLDEAKMPLESCHVQLSEFPHVPRELLDNPDSATYLYEPAILGGNFSNNKNPGAYGFRLKPEYRAVAQAKNPTNALAHAAVSYALNNVGQGNAYADLALTGRGAYDAFRSHQPSDNEILQAAQRLQFGPFRLNLPVTALQIGVQVAKIRAYQVAWALRNPDGQAAYELRRKLGWIAVSGEDDPPARPVNVPSSIPIFGPNGKQTSAYPQYEIPVTMCSAANAPYVPYECAPGTAGSVTFKIRYTVASSQAAAPGRTGITAAVPNK